MFKFKRVKSQSGQGTCRHIIQCLFISNKRHLLLSINVAKYRGEALQGCRCIRFAPSASTLHGMDGECRNGALSLFFVRWTLKPGLVSAAVDSEWPAMSNPPFFFALTLVFTAVSFPRVFLCFCHPLNIPEVARSLFSLIHLFLFFFSIKFYWRFRVFHPALVIVRLCRAWRKRIWFFPKRLSPTILPLVGHLPESFRLDWSFNTISLRIILWTVLAPRRIRKKGEKRHSLIISSPSFPSAFFFFSATKAIRPHL